MSAFTHRKKEKKHRNRTSNTKKWTHSDETNIISFLKQNREFEQPTARFYYTKFMEEYEMRNIYWKLLHHKVRNMRRVYRRAKEYEINKKDTNEMDIRDIKNVMLKICWYVDEFEELFPNEMDNYTQPVSKETSSDDEDSNQESLALNENNNSTGNFSDQCLQKQPTTTYLPKSIERDILAVQAGGYKRQKFDDDLLTRQEKYKLDKEQFMFEKEKFRQEIKVREKGIDSREKMKIMELEMKERIAMKELELKEKIALQSIEKHEPYNNVYHNMD